MSSSQIRLLGISGSLRRESFSTAILKTLAESAVVQAQIEIGNIRALPHYNQDLDTENAPASVVELRKALAESDGLVLLSPEYNHGVPGVLKNAIDWLSRPAYKSALIGKPTLIISSSPAFTGGVRAQPQLRETLISAMARPVIGNEVVIAAAHTKITNGRLTDKASIDFALRALGQLVDDIRAGTAAKAA